MYKKKLSICYIDHTLDLKSFFRNFFFDKNGVLVKYQHLQHNHYLNKKFMILQNFEI